MTTQQELATLQGEITSTLINNGCTNVEWRAGNSSYNYPYTLQYRGPDGKSVQINIGKSRAWAIHFLRALVSVPHA